MMHSSSESLEMMDMYGTFEILLSKSVDCYCYARFCVLLATIATAEAAAKHT